MIQVSLSIFYRSWFLTLEIIIIFLDKANYIATWLTYSWTNIIFGFNLNTCPKHVFNILSTLLTSSSNFRLLLCVKDSADIGGLIVTNLGYFKCISKFLDGIFFYKTKPFTQTAVTESGGAVIVIIFI